MMMMVTMIMNSDDDDTEESNGSHFSWQEYMHFFNRHLVIRSDIILLYACVYVYRLALQPCTVKAAGAYTNNTRLITLHDMTELQERQAI